MTTFQFYPVASATLFMLLSPLHASAHLMIEQRGAINIVDDGAFLVVSVPVSAFEGVDDDGDGLVSATEIRSHYERISTQVRRRLQLKSRAGSLPLEGLLINSANDHTRQPSAQLVVMGRFRLDSAPGDLRLCTSLFGRTTSEKQIQIAVRHGDDTQVLILSPKHPERPLFR